MEKVYEQHGLGPQLQSVTWRNILSSTQGLTAWRALSDASRYTELRFFLTGVITSNDEAFSGTLGKEDVTKQETKIEKTLHGNQQME